MTQSRPSLVCAVRRTMRWTPSTAREWEVTPAPIAVPATSRLGRGALKPWSTDAGGIAEPWLAESSSWPASLRSVLIPK